MHWIAPAAKDAASATLEKQLWDAADQLQDSSGLTSAEFCQSEVALALPIRTVAKLDALRVREAAPHAGHRPGRDHGVTGS